MDRARALAWRPPAEWTAIETLDAHTGGEPLRVLLDGVPEPPGATMLAKRAWAREHLDGLRRALVLEPRGHADMYAALPTAPVTPDGDLGVLFLHNEGWSTMCGHGVIALVTVALETGLLESRAAEPVVRLDTPAGRVVATAVRDADGRVREVAFDNVPSFLAARDAAVVVDGFGEVRFDLGFGGAFYAYVDAESLGFALEPSEHARLIDAARRIHRAVVASLPIRHPSGERELEFLYGVIFVRRGLSGLESRNVCVFAEGELDRSPTGTGVSGRAACLHARGALALGEEITIESLVGSRFHVRVQSSLQLGDTPAVVPRVRGSAHTLGRGRLWLDPADELGAGFLLR